MGTQEDAELLEEGWRQNKEDFLQAVECTHELLKEFEEMGLNKGAAIGGSLTHLLSHLIAVSPDPATALGLLSSCMTNAAINATRAAENHPGSDGIH
jgi:hypothetical protein